MNRTSLFTHTRSSTNFTRIFDKWASIFTIHNVNLYIYTMSNQNQVIQEVLPEAKPTSQQVEQALINVVKAGIYYRKPKDGKFMQNYKERVKKLRQAEDPDEYILENA